MNILVCISCLYIIDSPMKSCGLNLRLFSDKVNLHFRKTGLCVFVRCTTSLDRHYESNPYVIRH